MYLRLGLTLATMTLLATGCPHDEPIDSDSGDEGGSGEEGESGEESGSGEPLTEVSLAEFFPAAEQAFCAWQAACGGFKSVERCQEVVHFEERVSLRTIAGVGPDDAITPAYMQGAVDIDRIVFDGQAAATCLNYVSARTCDREQYHVWTEEELAGRAACEQVFAGRMGKNGPCARAIECAEEAICGFDPTCAEACCVGACRVLPADVPLGEPCPQNPNASCEPGTGCRFDPNTGLGTICDELAGEGEACDTIGCAEGLLCDFNQGTPRCEALADEGAPCDWDGMCKAGLMCAYDLDFVAGMCFRPADLGEKCMASPQSTCRRFDNACDFASETCVALPDVGEDCPDYSCAGDLFCTDTQKCSPMADEGEACGYQEQSGESIPCSGDLNCDYDNGQTCVPPNVNNQCPAPADV